MKLTAPIHQLRRQAKQLKQRRQIPLFRAQNEIAQQQGFSSWSLMIARQDDLLPQNSAELLDYFNVGDLVLIGARPRIGKTLFTACLIAECIKIGRPKSFYFTLVDRALDAKMRITNHLGGQGLDATSLEIDSSNNICAQYLIDCLSKQAVSGALVVIDYLQVLDENREQPPLQNQVEALKDFAKTSGCTFVFISQLDCNVGDRAAESPIISDIRLPNPLDTQLFNKILFLYRPSPDTSQTHVSLIRPVKHEFVMELDMPGMQFRDYA